MMGLLSAVARTAAQLFFFLSSIFSFAVSSSFVYHQFIRPRLFPWLDTLIAWHHVMFFCAFAASSLSLAPSLRGGRVRAAAAFAYLLAVGSAAAWLLGHPLFPLLQDGTRSFTFGLLFLMPPVWLGALEHLDSAAWARVNRLRSTLYLGEVLVAALGSAIYCWVVFGATALVRAVTGPAVALDASSAVLALAWSAAYQALAPVTLAILLWIAARSASRFGAAAVFAALALLGACAAATVLKVVVAPSIGLGGPQGSVGAASIGLAAAVVWSGAALRLTDRMDAQTPVDILLAPSLVRTRAAAAGALALAIPAAAFGTNALAHLDWDFLVQKMVAAAVIGFAFGCMCLLTRGHVRLRTVRPVVVSTLLLASIYLVAFSVERRISAAAPEPLSVEQALDAYAAINPAHRLLRDAWHAEPGLTREFLDYLKRHTNLTRGVKVLPARVEFGASAGPVADRPPDIFLFVVDSLRRDYLSPYNPAVTFTPAIARFAAESVVFDNAFTRYGGTGLSVPSIWAGSMLAHQQYTLPFEPMNALDRLLNDGGYRRFMTMDSVVRQIMPRVPGLRELDRGVPNMEVDFCRTAQELGAALRESPGDRRPVFAYTLPQGLHVVVARAIKEGGEAIAEGFHAPYATQVQRLDECFGTFVGSLKARGRYDDSIIVLTSDHGDSLGEGGQWGHAYALTPEVVRVPLMIHVPARLRGLVTVDPGAPVFTTDITPSLYALAGHRPPRRDPMVGAALFSKRPEDLPGREHGAFLIASSYGPVYGLLTNGGARFYVVDAIHTRDYYYGLTDAPGATRLVVPDHVRQDAQREIRRQIDQIGDVFEVVR